MIPNVDMIYVCDSCGEPIEARDILVGYHVYPDHNPNCEGDCCDCPVPAECGTVHLDLVLSLDKIKNDI